MGIEGKCQKIVLNCIITLLSLIMIMIQFSRYQVFLIVIQQLQFSLRYPHPFQSEFEARFIILLKMSDNLPIRKSLTALAGTGERKGYFYCLKLLGVLPPPPGSGFEEWKFYPPPAYYGLDQTPYTPKCLHDVLISSHATTCEHSSPYFAFYHRNLMALTEIFLNFAHQVLLGKFDKLKDIYKGTKHQSIYDSRQKQDLWQKVFDEYPTFYEKVPDQVSNHYWNPTDFKSSADLKLPEELTPKQEDKLDLIDSLFSAINGYYPWEVNVRERWYQNPPTEQKAKEDLTLIQYLVQQELQLSPEEKDMRNQLHNGSLDPKTNKDYTIEEINYFLDTWRGSKQHQNPYSATVVANRNWKYYKDSKFILSNNKPEETLAIYGSAEKNQQYINKQWRDKHLSDSVEVQNFNKVLPHWRLSQALFNCNINEFFIGSQIEKSHGQMHNYFHRIMSDPSFSVTSFVFWPYHSWIDCEIEIYLRRANAKKVNTTNSGPDPSAQMSNNLNTLIYHSPIFGSAFKAKDAKGNQFEQNLDDSTVKRIIQQIKIQQEWNIVKGKKLNFNLMGYYPILQYTSPDIRKLIRVRNQQKKHVNDVKVEAAFIARDYIMNLTNQNTLKLRTSNDLNQIYQDKYIDILHPNRFKFLNNIKEHNFNYNYQIGSSPADLGRRLDDFGEELPQYLIQLEKQWKVVKQTRKKAQDFASKKSKLVRSIKTSQKEPKLMGIAGSPPLKEQQEIIEEPKSHEEINEEKAVRKLFESGIHVYVAYPSTTKNGNVSIYATFNNIVKLSKQLSEDEQFKLLEKCIKQKINVGGFVIFGRQQGSKKCPRCPQIKIKYLDIDQQLRVVLPKLWRFIHKESLNEVLYDSLHPEHKVRCIYEKINLVPNDVFVDYRFVGGAEEIEVEVVSKIKSPQSQFIRIDAECYSVKRNSINNILSKKFYSFANTKFDFYKSFDVNTQGNTNHFDQYVYKVLKGWISLGSKRVDFSVKIPCFQRLFRIRVEILFENEELRVKVYDTDFEAKTQYYNVGAEKHEELQQ